MMFYIYTIIHIYLPLASNSDGFILSPYTLRFWQSSRVHFPVSTLLELRLLALGSLAKRTPLLHLFSKCLLSKIPSNHMNLSEHKVWMCPKHGIIYIYIIIIIIIIIYIIYYFYNLAFNVGSIHVNLNHMGFRASHSCSSRRQWTCSLWTWDSKLRTGWWSTTHFMAWLEGKSTGNPWYFYVFLRTHDRGLQKKWSLQLQNQSND